MNRGAFLDTIRSDARLEVHVISADPILPWESFESLSYCQTLNDKTTKLRVWDDLLSSA